MNPEIFAEWLRRQGHRIFQTESSYWYDQGPRVYQAFPYHRIITPRINELDCFLKKNRGIALRYSTAIDGETGAGSYHVAIGQSNYSLEGLPKNARYDVRKGLKSTNVEQISFERMAKEGWQLRLETIKRQGREKAETKSWWENLCMSTKGLSGFEAWAAISRNRMLASIIAFSDEDTFSIIYQQSLSEALPMCVNNALSYEVTLSALSRSNISEVFYGLHSLDAPPSVDQFKFRMGYTAKPVRQRVVFHPNLAPLVNVMSHTLLRGLKQIQPDSSMIAKAEGMVRFYREGKLPLDQQSLPQVLKGNDLLQI